MPSANQGSGYSLRFRVTAVVGMLLLVSAAVAVYWLALRGSARPTANTPTPVVDGGSQPESVEEGIAVTRSATRRTPRNPSSS
jgi:hypothetical protein